MTSFTLNLISVKVSFHDIFKKMLNITPVNITSFTVYNSLFQKICVLKIKCIEQGEIAIASLSKLSWRGKNRE